MRFSIIIPVYNDPDGLTQTMESIQSLRYDEAYEVFVVDNNSSDNTSSIAKKFADQIDNVHILLENSIQSSYAARNRGIKHATGDIYLFLDANMTVEKDWLQLWDRFYSTNDVDYAGCYVELYTPIEHETIFAQYNMKEGFPVEMYINKRKFAPTCCLSVTQEVVSEVGGFIPILKSGGDAEFGKRVASAGYRQRFADHITVYHPARITFQEHVSKARRLGEGREQQYQLSLESGREWYHPKNFLPPHPLRFIDRLQSDVNRTQILLFYTLAFVFKLFAFYGQFEERICGIKSRFKDQGDKLIR